MSRRTQLSLALLVLAALGVVLGGLALARRVREAVIDAFAEERLAQVDRAARATEDELAMVGDDLQFAGRLAESADPASRAPELAALLAGAEPYRALEVHGADGGVLVRVVDPRKPLAPERDDGAVLAVAARDALGHAATRGAGVTPLSIAGTGPLRAFAIALPPAPGLPRRAIAVLVDTRQLFASLRLVTTPGSRFLLVGPHEQAVLATDTELSASYASPGTPALVALREKLRERARGTLRLEPSEAMGLGLAEAPAIAVFDAIAPRGGGFSIAMLSSTAPVSGELRVRTSRVALVAAALLVALAFVARAIVLSSRRARALRERLEHADRVAHLHDKTEKILDHIPTGVMALSEDLHISAVNRALRDRIPEAAIGARLDAAFPEAPAAVIERIERLVASALADGRVASVHGERLALFGEEGQYSLHAVPLEPRFPEARVLLVVEDLSEVRSLASQLLRAEKLATVGVLAAGIAHEIGTPLGVVRGRAEYVLGKLGSDHAQAASVRVIVEQIDVVTRTIRNLLDFSRVVPAAVHPVAVAQVARAVAELLRFEAERRKVRIELDVADDLVPAAANADELQQVLVNLIMNALDGCRPGGRVAVRARDDAADAGDVWRTLLLEVEDDGRGILPEHRTQVFDPFFTTKKRGQGTGLGLTITAQIVRNHGGTIELESEPGRGTKVTLRWPVVRAKERHAVAI